MWIDDYNKVKGVTLDITPRCTLLCNKCGRQDGEFPLHRPKMQDMTMRQYEMMVDYFDDLRFCGSYGDAVLHRDFITMLEMAYERGKTVDIPNSASHKSKQWYTKAFKAHPTAKWVFGIDGLPKDSHKYRVNQDGEHLFEMMKMAHDMGINAVWQYIIFKYNQKDIDTAREIADKLGIPLTILRSKRFTGPDDPLMPDSEDDANIYWAGEDTSKLTKEEKMQRYFRYKLQPKCLHKDAYFATHPQGYLVPCCWMTPFDVEKDIPFLCNEETHLDNVNSVEEIINSVSWQNHFKKITSSDKTAPFKCWRKCHMGAPLSKTPHEKSSYVGTRG